MMKKLLCILIVAVMLCTLGCADTKGQTPKTTEEIQYTIYCGDVALEVGDDPNDGLSEMPLPRLSYAEEFDF